MHNEELAKSEFSLAMNAFNAGNLPLSERHFRNAYSFLPERCSILTNLSAILILQNKYADALSFSEKSIRIEPENAEGWLNCGICQLRMNNLQRAIELFEKSLTINPRYAEAYKNLGDTYYSLKKYDTAIEQFQKAIQINSTYYEAILNLSIIYHDMRQFSNAIAELQNIPTSSPLYVSSLSSIGYAYHELNKPSEALSYFDRALLLEPTNAKIHFSRSLINLLQGDYTKGWEEYEWRWKYSEFSTKNREFDRPLWINNKDINGKSILLYAEQGFGDTIQFSRYISLVKNLGANVILEVQPLLHSLFETTYPELMVIARGDVLPKFDYQCPLMSLPLAFHTTLDTIPSPTPIKYQRQLYEQWQYRVNSTQGNINVGMAWSGSPGHQHDSKRSIPLILFESILKTPNINWHCTQKEIREIDQLTITTHPEIAQYSEQLKEFSDTAALIAQMDLVITVDTSIAHLSASLGKPTWLLIPFVPDFRWLKDRIDSPWYPTVQLFRQQEANNWSAVIANVSDSLNNFLSLH